MAPPSVAQGNPALASFVRALETEPDFRDALVHREPLPAQPASFAELPPAYADLVPVLARRGIAALYTHQARALASLASGIVRATPTASGKTLVYSLSTLRSALADPRARALYLFPLKALSQDQRLPARWNVPNLIESASAAIRYAERPRRLRSSSSKSIRAVTGSAAAIVTTTRSPSS